MKLWIYIRTILNDSNYFRIIFIHTIRKYNKDIQKSSAGKWNLSFVIKHIYQDRPSCARNFCFTFFFSRNVHFHGDEFVEKVTRHRVYSQLSGSHPRKSVRTRIRWFCFHPDPLFLALRVLSCSCTFRWPVLSVCPPLCTTRSLSSFHEIVVLCVAHTLPLAFPFLSVLRSVCVSWNKNDFSSAGEER